MCISHGSRCGFDVDGQIHDGDVDRRHPHMQALETVGKLRHQAINSFGESGVNGNNRMEGAAGEAKISMVVPVNHRLIVHGRVDGC